MIDTVIEELAEALLRRDALQLRLLVQIWKQHNPNVAELPCPATRDPRVRTAAAALTELLALQLAQAPRRSVRRIQVKSVAWLGTNTDTHPYETQ